MGRTRQQWNRADAGWLKNPLRKARYESKELTLTDSQVVELVKRIKTMKDYTKLGKKNPKMPDLIKTRDEALVSVAWLFIKRGGEYLRLKLKDVGSDGRELQIVYSIEKKQKRKKLCPKCNEYNKLKALFCSNCSLPISNIEPVVISAPSPLIVTKTKLMGTSPLIGFFLKWVSTVREMNPDNPDAYLFAKVLSASEKMDFGNHVGVQRLDQILQRLDPSITSHFFRYGHTEVLLMLDYTESEAKEAGDWEKEDMVHTYGKKVQKHKAAKKFAEETRAL